NTFSDVGLSNIAVSPTYGDAFQFPDDLDMPGLEDIIYSDDEDVVGAEADFNNLKPSIPVSPIPTTSIHKDHPTSQIIGDLSFEKLMKDKFQMSSIGELTFFLSLQVKQKEDGIFISQDKYVAKILRKFRLTEGKSASTPIDTEKPLQKDPDGEDIDVYIYRSMIGSIMYLTSSRPDIMFAVCACARFQVSPKASHLHAVKRIFRYLKGKPHLGLWYPKDSPFDLVAYSDSDYAGTSLDRKSTTGGCQFLRCRLISWQCKKQTVVATSSTKAEYVVAASCCAQNWLVQKLMALGKDISNPLMANNLPKIVWYSTHHITLMKSWLVQKQTALGKTTTGKEILNPFMAGSLPKTILTTFLHIMCLNMSPFEFAFVYLVITSMYMLNRGMWLVDKKKVLISKAVIRDVLRLDDAERVDCLPNEEIFTGLTRRKLNFSMYIFDSLVRNVDSSSKVYMYPRFIQLIIQNQLVDLSTHTITYISPALTQKVFANMRRVGKGFSGVETYLFEGMLVVGKIKEHGDEEEQDNDAQGADADVLGDDVQD
nr:uncharacterized mitochondrial protein AtMg00810-like [Tanacetum cinerariifolium]